MSTEMKTKQIALVVKTMEVARIPAKIDEKRVAAFRAETAKAYDVAEAMIVKDIETKVTAESLATACSVLKKKVIAYFKLQIEEAAEKKREATAEKAEIDALVNTMTEVLKQAQDAADRKVRDYVRAENKRVEDENRKKELEAQKAAEEKKKDQVAELKEIGTPEARRAARELATAPAIAAPIQAEQKISSTRGTIIQQKWVARAISTVADATGDNAAALALLVEAAYNEPEKYIKYLMINWPAVNRAAITDKEMFFIPGFEAVDEGKTLHK